MWKRGITPTLLQLKEAVKNNQTTSVTFEVFCNLMIERSNRKKGTKYNLRGTLVLLIEFRAGYTSDCWRAAGH